MLLRVLPPWHSNAGKRLVRTPKVYPRETGLLHALWGWRPTRHCCAPWLRRFGTADLTAGSAPSSAAG